MKVGNVAKLNSQNEGKKIFGQYDPSGAYQVRVINGPPSCTNHQNLLKMEARPLVSNKKEKPSFKEVWKITQNYRAKGDRSPRVGGPAVKRVELCRPVVIKLASSRAKPKSEN